MEESDHKPKTKEEKKAAMTVAERLNKILQPRKTKWSMGGAHSQSSSRSSRTYISRRSTTREDIGRVVSHHELTFLTSEPMLARRELVILDTRKVNEAFSDDPKYIPGGGKGALRPHAELKYESIRERFQHNKVVPVLAAHFVNRVNPTHTASAVRIHSSASPTRREKTRPLVPHLSSLEAKSPILSDSKSRVHISSGSTVFCVLRDAKIQAIPFLVPRDEADDFEDRFGMGDTARIPEVQVRTLPFYDSDHAPWRNTSSFQHRMQNEIAKINLMAVRGLDGMKAVKTVADDPYDRGDAVAELSSFGTSASSTSKWKVTEKEINDVKRRLRFVVPDKSLAGRAIVMTDAMKVEPSFLLDAKYVGRDGENSRRMRSAARYQEIRASIRKSRGPIRFPIPCAELWFPYEGDPLLDPRAIELVSFIVHFVEGSHHFAFLRDIGCPAIPILVNSDEAADFKSEFECDDFSSIPDPTEHDHEQIIPSWTKPRIEVRDTSVDAHPWRKKWKKKEKPQDRHDHDSVTSKS
eukprot:TRINITY_DN82818_c0_g1_i1.p1 TRINITY_DN82818_c0_g1~~TRINITY_DN82818_c0_g1_i1.p1  ORF type:complete len:523 (+),score=117.73 TRINITY_DN82818_c0_g1_i1:247-1815(+)